MSGQEQDAFSHDPIALLTSALLTRLAGSRERMHLNPERLIGLFDRGTAAFGLAGQASGETPLVAAAEQNR